MVKIPERHQGGHSGIFIVNFKDISHLVLVLFCLLWAGKCRLGKYPGGLTEIKVLLYLQL